MRERVREVVRQALEEVGAELAGDLGAATGPASRAAGEQAVDSDLASLYAKPSAVHAMLREESPQKAAAFLRGAEEGAGTGRLQGILEGTRLAGLRVLDGPDEDEHAEFLRGGHGRRSEPAAVVRDAGAWRQFAARLRRSVGSARKGWVDAAEDLGGGAKGWVRAGGRSLGEATVEARGSRVRVVLRNFVRYAVLLLPASERRRLVASAARRARARIREGLR